MLSKVNLYRNYITKVYLKRNIEKYPFLFLLIQRYRHRNRNKIFFNNRIVGKHCDLVIDGFPRSANSFCVKAFTNAQLPQKVQIGHHLHSIAAIKRAIQLKLPIIVVIREPYDAIVSYGSFTIQLKNFYNNNKKKYSEEWRIKWDIQYYIDFYSEIYKIMDHVILAPFDEVTNDFGLIINKMNKKFKSNFISFDHSIENEQEIFKNSWSHLSPSNERNSIKPFVKKLLENKECKDLLSEADNIFKQLISKNNDNK